MRIGLDLTCITDKPTGIGNYALFLTRELLRQGDRHEFILFCHSALDAESRFRLGGRNDNVKIVDLPPKRVPIWDRHIRDARIMMGERLDILHGPANTLPLFYKGKTVVTINDLAIYKHPEWFPSGQWFSRKVVVPRSIKKANHIIAISENTKKDIMELFNVAEKKITVIPLAAESSPDAPDVPDLPDRKYILFVGTIEPRKNVARLVQAYTELPEDLQKKYDLVIAGKWGWNFEEVKLKIENYKLKIGEDKIKIMEYVSHEDLLKLYSGATLFVFPSLYEGFGLPVLEAMAAGTPTICGKQIADNFHTPYSPDTPYLPFEQVDAYDTADISKKIEQVLRDEKKRRDISQKGKEFAGQFTWEKTALKTLEVFSRVKN